MKMFSVCSHTDSHLVLNHRAGEVALALIDTVEIRESLAWTLMMVFAFCRNFTHDMRESIKSLVYAHKVGYVS